MSLRGLQAKPIGIALKRARLFRRRWSSSWRVSSHEPRVPKLVIPDGVADPGPYSAKSEGVPALHFVSAGMTLFWMAFYLDAFLVIPLVHQTALSSVTRQIAHRQSPAAFGPGRACTKAFQTEQPFSLWGRGEFLNHPQSTCKRTAAAAATGAKAKAANTSAHKNRNGWLKKSPPVARAAAALAPKITLGA